MVSEEENKQNTVGARNECVMVFFSVATMFCTLEKDLKPQSLGVCCSHPSEISCWADKINNNRKLCNK